MFLLINLLFAIKNQTISKNVTRINLSKLFYLLKLKTSFKSRADFTFTLVKQDTLFLLDRKLVGFSRVLL